MDCPLFLALYLASGLLLSKGAVAGEGRTRGEVAGEALGAGGVVLEGGAGVELSPIVSGEDALGDDVGEGLTGIVLDPPGELGHVREHGVVGVLYGPVVVVHAHAAESPNGQLGRQFVVAVGRPGLASMSSGSATLVL